jgi:hypothetical protein
MAPTRRLLITGLAAGWAAISLATHLPIEAGIDLVLSAAYALVILFALLDALKQLRQMRERRDLGVAERAALKAYRRLPFHFNAAMDRLRELDARYQAAMQAKSMDGAMAKYLDPEKIELVRRKFPLLHARMAKICRDAGEEEEFRRHAGTAMNYASDLQMEPPLNGVEDVYAYALREDGKLPPR